MSKKKSVTEFIIKDLSLLTEKLKSINSCHKTLSKIINEPGITAHLIAAKNGMTNNQVHKQINKLELVGLIKKKNKQGRNLLFADFENITLLTQLNRRL